MAKTLSERLRTIGRCHDDDAPLAADEIDRLQRELATALTYAARENSKAYIPRKKPCSHNEYWTTWSGRCMACRATEAESEAARLTQELSAERARWIPVGERLPENNANIVVYHECRNCSSPHPLFDAIRRWSPHWNGKEHFTHWMPLPPPPSTPTESKPFSPTPDAGARPG